MRNTIWRFIGSRLPEGMILPWWWALTIMAALFPLEFFYWRMSKRTGYRWEDDTWLINGVRYSGESMRWLANAKGETYRIERTGDTVTLTRAPNAPGKPTAATEPNEG